MLSPDDSAFVKREPGMPGLATLLDPAAISLVLSRSGHRQPARASYIRYKPGTNCLVKFGPDYPEAPDSPGNHACYAKAYHVDKWRSRRSQQGCNRGALLLDAAATAIYSFPHDRILKSVPALASRQTRNSLLQRLGLAGESEESQIVTLAYKPERRYVAKVDRPGARPIVLRCYEPSRYSASNQVAKRLKSGAGFKCPRRLGKSSRHSLVAMEWLDGTILADAFPENGLRRIEEVGAALAAFHGSAQLKLVPPSTKAYEQSIIESSRLLIAICPHLRARLSELAEMLASNFKGRTQVQSVIHGDFYAHQVVLQDDGVALVDFDRATVADPAIDLGSFAAHLEFEVAGGGLSDNVGRTAVENFLSGYQAASSFRPTRGQIDFHCAVGLFQRLPQAFRHRRQDWVQQIGRMVERVHELARGSGVVTRRCTRRSTRETSVAAAEGLLTDSKFSFLQPLLGPTRAPRVVEIVLPGDTAGAMYSMSNPRVRRHKVGRRCLIECQLKKVGQASFPALGKVRAKGLDWHGYAIQRRLYQAGFDDSSDDGISVPTPVGVVPAYQMWFQREIPSRAPWEFFDDELRGPEVARRLAAALYKLHSRPVETSRKHTIQDELAILQERLADVEKSRPELSAQVSLIATRCLEIAELACSGGETSIHRDFYHDQALVQAKRIYLVDHDLYCRGDPLLDVGNFVAHVTELALRTHNNAKGYEHIEQAFVDQYAELLGREIETSVAAYAVLSLARLIHISTRIAARAEYTPELVKLCLDRLTRLHWL